MVRKSFLVFLLTLFGAGAFGQIWYEGSDPGPIWNGHGNCSAVISEGGLVYLDNWNPCLWVANDQQLLSFMRPDSPYTFDFRHRNIKNAVNVTTTSSYARGDVFQFTDGVYRLMIMFSPQGTRIANGKDTSQHIVIPASDIDPKQWQQFRLECHKSGTGTFDLVINGPEGTHVYSGTLDIDHDWHTKGVSFGAGNSITGEGHWDYIYGYSEIEVEIDLKPGTDSTTFNCRAAKSILPVAILSTESFDALQVDPESVTFEGALETHKRQNQSGLTTHIVDIDQDGDFDLVFHFRVGETALSCDSVAGTLSGYTFDGIPIYGVTDLRSAR